MSKVIDSDKFMACIGKLDSSPQVKKLLAAVGFTKKLKIPSYWDKASAYLPKQGLLLTFEPEDKKVSRSHYKGPLLLSSAKFYSKVESDLVQKFESYQGALPRHVLFSDSRTQVRKKLGTPFYKREAMYMDDWKLNGLLLSVEYSKDYHVAMVEVWIMPEDFLPKKAADIPVWDIDSALEPYARLPEKYQQEVEMQYQLLFRFMNDNKLLTKNVVDRAGKLKVRKLFTKDFTRRGNSFAMECEVKWLGSKSSSDPVKGPKRLEKYLKELRRK